MALAFRAASQVTRESLYGTLYDRQLPAHLEADARLPFLGFVGPEYRPDGTCLFAINPGGGGDSYQQRTEQDELLCPEIFRLRATSAESARTDFERMSAVYLAQAKAWNLSRIIGPVVDACRTEWDRIAYLNVFPYRTARDGKPAAVAIGNAWPRMIEPILTALSPSRIVVLGRKAAAPVLRFYDGRVRLFVVPRTIGDGYVSTEARRVLQEIKDEFSE